MSIPKSYFTLYWNSLDNYEHCPRKFLWSRGWYDIDLGRGLGKKKKPQQPGSWHHAMMGIVIGDTIDDLYTKELWRDPSTLRARLEVALKARFKKQMDNPKKPILWYMSPDHEGLLKLCRDGVLNYLGTMRANKFLGPWTKAEYDMKAYVDRETPIGGRADIVFERSDTGRTILDGKNSLKKLDPKNPEKHSSANPNQLKWYALTMYLSQKKIVDRLGFVFYRFPYDLEKKETGVMWIDHTMDDLKDLAARAVDARKRMFRHEFEPVPVPSYCKNCDFESECPERQEQRAANAAKRKKKNPVDDLEGFKGGVVEV